MKTIHPAIAEHVMEESSRLQAENEKLRGLLQKSLDYFTESGLPEDLAAEYRAALSQQAEPKCDWPTCECALDPDKCKVQSVEQAPAQDERVAIYVECCECTECGHAGINDQADGDSACSHCLWSGPSPDEDKCPECQREGTMSASCPKCGCRYRLIADAQIAARAAHTEQQAAYPHDAMDAIALSRYRVGASGPGTLHRYAVRAGDGEQELYRGSKSDCEHVARKLAGAFLDGGLAAIELYAAPIAQTAPQPEQSDLAAQLYPLLTEWKPKSRKEMDAKNTAAMKVMAALSAQAPKHDDTAI